MDAVTAWAGAVEVCSEVAEYSRTNAVRARASETDSDEDSGSVEDSSVGPITPASVEAPLLRVLEDRPAQT